MPFNVPEEQRPQFNKKVQESLGLLAQDIEETLGLAQAFRPKTLVDAYNEPVQPMDMEEREMVSLTPEEERRQSVTRSIIVPLADPSGNIPKSTAEVFSAPLDYNKVKALGLVDGNGNATEKGELFYNLQQAGMFNDDGVITDKGQAYLTPVTEIGKPENLRAFKTLWDDKVIRPSATFSEVASGTGKLLIDAAAGGAERIGQEAQSLFHNSKTWDGFFGNADMRPQKLKDEMTATGLGLIEGATENLAAWAGMADIASAWVGKKVYDVIPVGLDDDAEEALYAARQRQWQTQQDIANLSAGEVAETVLGIDGAIKAAEEAKSQIGSAEFDKKYGRSQAFANIAADPSNFIPASVAFKASQTAPLASRVALTAQRRLGQIAAQDLAIAQAKTAIESANSVLKKEALTVGLANKMSSDIAARAGSNPELVARASRASQVAQRITNDANKIRETLPIVTAELDSLVAKRNSLATRIPEEYSKKALQTMEFGRQVRAMPAKAIGATLERIGNTFSKTDAAITNFLQERGLDQMYTAAVGAAGVAGLAGNPVIGAIGAGAATLKTGKILSNYGKLFRYVGKEMENVRGQIPFWKRVAAHTAPGSFGRGVAHTFNMLDLGGVTSDVLRRTGRGVVVAAPTDLMFEYLSDGADMRPETLYQAASESLVIGGAFAAAGGAFMGTKKRMRELSIGDQLNFMRDMTDPRQKALFQSIPSGVQRAIATYSIANPTLNYVFKDSGSSRYDVNTNTAIINVRSTNPIKALVAHETLHHALIKNNMEPGIAALFLGDTKNNTVGGLLRSRDGKLDPNFEAFKNAYYKRLGVEGMSNAEVEAIYPLDKIAVEYFIEKHADQYSSMAESGELGAIAASGAIKRKLGSALETILPRIPILKDLHFKSGGMIDKNGSWVTGNGILDAEGIKSDPITKKMFRDMNRRSAGLVPGQFDPLISDRPDSGAPIMLDPNDGIDAELLHPLVKVDETGKPILQNGKPVALDRATELERALAGLTAIDVLKRKRDANYAPEKGEAHVDAEGVFQPGWLSNDVLNEMFAKNRYNAEQKRIIREVNRLIRKGIGDRMVMVNFPATTRNKAGKAIYKPQGATLRDTVPVAITISKDGNLLFGLMSVTKLQENIQKRSQSKRGKKLYGGNVDLILRDVQAMMDYHKNGVDSIEFFKEKYGAVEAEERKRFINTMFGLLNQKEQGVLNPILVEDGVKSKDNVYRTYRADRVSKAVPMSPEEYPAMPFSYEAVSKVRMPEAQRMMPDVAVVPERFTGSREDADRRGKYVEPPGFFKKFNISSYERGGRFFDAESGEDLTGKNYSTGSIDVSTGRPKLSVDNISDPIKNGSRFKANLFKQSAGWKWTSENAPNTSTIVSIEGQGKHVYALRANFESGVELARYSEKKSEPRLRPTAYGKLKLGNPIGEISIRGKLHQVYDSIGIVPKSIKDSRFMPEGIDEDKFYSQLERVIISKVPSRATAAQIMATIDPTRGSGVKADEIKWSGIEQALASLEKDGKVSKEDLLNYLRNEGKIRFKEVTSQGPTKPVLQPGVRVEQVDGDWYITSPVDDEGPFDSREEAQAALDDPNSGYWSTDANLVDMERGSPLFEQYTLRGGRNYREVVLTMLPQDKQNIKSITPNPDGGFDVEFTNGESGLFDSIEEARADGGTGSGIEDKYRSSHFPDIPNYVAHMRTNERTLDDGSEGLFVEEFQSDRHQAGRKKGYKEDITPKDIEAAKKAKEDAEEKLQLREYEIREEYGFPISLKEIIASGRKLEYDRVRDADAVRNRLKEASDQARQRYASLIADMSDQVPDAPFRTTWPIQLFKRALRDAVDGGKDWIGWTTGETQNDRFDLSKRVDRISVPMVNADGSRSVRIDPKDGTSLKMMVDSTGIVNGYQSADQFTGKRLDEVVGKDMADKIIALESPANFEGNDLKVGGSGMRGFYDNILPKEIGKYVKQWGGKVEKEEIDIREPASEAWYKEPTDNDYKPIWIVSITPEMREISQTGQTRFMPEKLDSDYMKAVESGDVEAQQKMVDAAANAAGFKRVLKTVPLEYQPTSIKPGDWVSSDTQTGWDYQAEYLSPNWRNENHVIKAYVREVALSDRQTGFANGQTLVVDVDEENPENIQSAELVVYDKKGNVIPLSARFQSSINPK